MSSSRRRTAPRAPARPIGRRCRGATPPLRPESTMKAYPAAVAKALHGIANPSGSLHRHPERPKMGSSSTRSLKAEIRPGPQRWSPRRLLAMPVCCGSKLRWARPARTAAAKRFSRLPADGELGYSPDREAFPTVKVGSHFKNYPVRSKDFREWLSGGYFGATGAAPGSRRWRTHFAFLRSGPTGRSTKCACTSASATLWRCSCWARQAHAGGRANQGCGRYRLQAG